MIRREGVDGRSTGNVTRETLFARAELPERSVAEGSKMYGEAVVKMHGEEIVKQVVAKLLAVEAAGR